MTRGLDTIEQALEAATTLTEWLHYEATGDQRMIQYDPRPDIDRVLTGFARVRAALENGGERAAQPDTKALLEIVACLCGDDFRLNGCACRIGEKCYLHGVTIPRALAGQLPDISADEMRFLRAAAVEYVRAENALAAAEAKDEALRAAEDLLDETEQWIADTSEGAAAAWLALAAALSVSRAGEQ